ncbi:MAG: ketopantoate reductase family protein [Gammaproteobacteria bacterium]
MADINKVCVVGAGTIGSLLAGHLGTLFETAVLVRREEHARALNEQGLKVSGKAALHARVKASTDPAALGDVELLIIATKAPAVEAATSVLQGHFPNAHVLMIQNGLGCEQVVQQYGDWPLISGVTFMSGTRHSDTHVEYELDTATWMGPWAEGHAGYEFVQQVAALFVAAGLKAEAYQDLRPHQWSKLIFNSAVNSIAAITDLPHISAFALEDKLTDLGHLVHAMMDEAGRIAAAQGVQLADDPWEMNVKAVRQGSTSGEEYAHIPSMLDDVRSKRATEIDWITGAIVREARKAGIPAPYHETMYRLVKAYESSWERKQ